MRPSFDLNILKITVLLILLSLGQACIHSPLPLPIRKPRGIYHIVKKNETLWRICHTYDVDLQDVAELNNIEKTSRIRAGDRIFIPGAKKRLWVKPVKNKTVKSVHKKPAIKNKKKRPVKKTTRTKIVSNPGMFQWPVKGTVIKRFGIYNKTKHDGINIKAPAGTAVKASQSGKVVFSSFLEGYGNTIIVEHKNSYMTVYANNRTNLAGIGKWVKTGERIATVGTSAGKSENPYLHFQVRRYDKPRNPAFYLTKK